MSSDPTPRPKRKSRKSKVKYKTRPEQFIRPVRWMVENDYRGKLSPEDKLFLDKFNEAYAGDNPQTMYRSKRARRQLWRETQKIRRDALSYVHAGLPLDAAGAKDHGGGGHEGGRDLRETVHMNQEDIMIETIDSHAQPYGQHLMDRVRARREAREFDEECARLAVPKVKKRRSA